MTGRTRLTAQAALATVAASAGLSAVFTSMRWLMPVVGAIVLVAAVSELARRTRFAAAFGPVVAAVAVLLYVTALDARDVAYAGVIPTAASLQQLADLVRGAFTDIRSLATPVPAHSGLVLLAVVGLAAVELVVDLLAVTLRRAAIAGLPLLAVFALCTSVARHGVGWMPFAVGTFGYLWLLLADSKDRVSRWGRALGAGTDATGTADEREAYDGRPRLTWADADAAASPLSALGRRVGVTAIAIGLVVPLLIPGLRGGVPKGGGSGNGPGNGSSKVVTVNPIVTLQRDLTSSKATPVLRLRSSDASPGYLRLTSLDRFDGTLFSPSDLNAPSSSRIHGRINAPLLSGPRTTTRITVGSLDVHWLPVPTQAENVDVSGDWHYDAASNTIFSARSTTKQLTYSVTSVRNEPSRADLDTVGFVAPTAFASTLALPPIPADVSALARRVTAGSSTPLARAVAIQHFLDSPPFTYSTDVSIGNSTDALRQFLFVTRRGYCQQYAAAMAVLARIVGIPSRVAVGFTHGDRQKDGSWLVTTHDAHAWPELYFAGFGWLPFEPTPRADGQAVPPPFTEPSTTSPQTTPEQTQPTPATPDNTGLNRTLKGPLQDEAPPVVPPPADATARSASASYGWWILLAVLGALLVVPSSLRVATRRRRWARASSAPDLAHAAWTELRAVAIDAGAPWLDGVTPRATARVLAADVALDAEATAALAWLVAGEERARYAPTPAAADGATVKAAVATVRHGLFARRPWWARIVAAALPRSTLLGLRAGSGRVADLLDLLDSTGARLRRLLPWRTARPA